MEFGQITFLKPYWLLGLIVIPVIIYFLFFYNKKSKIFIFFDDLKLIYKKNDKRFYVKIALLILILANFFVLLADPNLVNQKDKIKKNGIDIILVLDISKSMEAIDLLPNRIEAEKKVFLDFIKTIETDRVGLIVFAGRPFTSVPLTFDYGFLQDIIKDISTDTINQYAPGMGNTAIGDAILSAVNMFKKLDYNTGRDVSSKRPDLMANPDLLKRPDREKIIILATDGHANYGIDPVAAAGLSKKNNIKIYSIGVGSLEGGYIEQDNFFGKTRHKVEGLDEKSLQEISKTTNGQYFRATDNDAFKNILQKISQFEKKDLEIESSKEYKEFYKVFTISLFLLLGGFVIVIVLFDTKEV